MAAPPGLCTSEPESATVSRERRRVALAARTAVSELSNMLLEHLREQQSSINSLHANVDSLLGQGVKAETTNAEPSWNMYIIGFSALKR